MRKILVVLILSFFDLITFGQIYFNNSYKLGPTSYWDFSTTILSLDTGYILYGQNLSYDYSIGHITLLRLDQYGERQWLKEYDEPGIIYGCGYPKSLIPTPDEQYALTGMTWVDYPGWIRQRGLLMKLDENFDSLWIKTYGDNTEPCDTAVIFRQLINASDGGFAIFGGIMDYNDQQVKFYLLRTDSIGGKIWEQQYGPAPFQYDAVSFTGTSDYGYLLGGAQWIDSTHSVDPILYKTDSLGNEEWFLNLGSNYYDGAFLVDTLLDGNIIVTTNISDSACGNSSFYGRNYFAKLDNSGNIIWSKKYGASYVDNYVWSIDVLPDGRIVSTGSRWSFAPIIPDRVSWIFCINSEGDSLWYREYALLIVDNGVNYLYDVVEANDSGFIACGYVFPLSTDGNWQDTWVIKVDSIGCESPDNCWVAIEEPDITQIEKGKLTAFPNPATEQITFEMDGEEIKAGSIITVYDIYGRLYYEKFLPKSAVSLTVDISTWSGGIYIARLTYMNNVVGDVKFIVD